MEKSCLEDPRSAGRRFLPVTLNSPQRRCCYCFGGPGFPDWMGKGAQTPVRSGLHEPRSGPWETLACFWPLGTSRTSTRKTRLVLLQFVPIHAAADSVPDTLLLTTIVIVIGTSPCQCSTRRFKSPDSDCGLRDLWRRAVGHLSKIKQQRC